MNANEHAGPVLIAYDGSEFAKAAIEQAAALLRPGLEAVVVTVFQPLRSIAFAPLTVMPEELSEAITKEAQATAEEGAEHARRLGFEASATAVEGVAVWHDLLDFAEQRDARLIVTGSHGRTGIRYVAMGSVATALVQHSRRPVFVGRTGSD